MISVQISDTLVQYHLQCEDVSTLLIKAAEVAHNAAAGATEAEATIVITDDEQLTQLNQTYRGIQAPTDVLSFPDGEADPETGITYLGDIIVSYPRAQVQAVASGHPIEAELQLLVVHGMLHLCGYDHAEPAEKAVMWQLQSEVLARLDCPIAGPTPEAED